jgi:hypothetical protein
MRLRRSWGNSANFIKIFLMWFGLFLHPRINLKLMKLLKKKLVLESFCSTRMKAEKSRHAEVLHFD